MPADDSLTEADRIVLQDLHAADDPRTFATRLYTYYHDADRSRRTSRELMILHLGMACGMLLRGKNGADHDD